MEPKDWTLTLIIIFIVVGMGLWTLLPRVSTPEIRAGGFDKLIPILLSISYNDSDFSAIFANEEATTVKINSVKVKETGAKTSCQVLSPEVGKMVNPGDYFSLDAVCPSRKEGDNYELNVTIRYTYSWASMAKNGTESGRINGRAREAAIL